MPSENKTPTKEERLRQIALSGNDYCSVCGRWHLCKTREERDVAYLALDVLKAVRDAV